VNGNGSDKTMFVITHGQVFIGRDSHHTPAGMFQLNAIKTWLTELKNPLTPTLVVGGFGNRFQEMAEMLNLNAPTTQSTICGYATPEYSKRDPENFQALLNQYDAGTLFLADPGLLFALGLLTRSELCGATAYQLTVHDSGEWTITTLFSPTTRVEPHVLEPA